MSTPEMQKLMSQRYGLFNTALQFVESKEAGGMVTGKIDIPKYQQMEKEILDLDERIAVMKRQQEQYNAELAAVHQAAYIPPAPVTNSAPMQQPLFSQPGERDTRGGNEYGKAFWNALRGRGVSNILSEGSDTSGGFLVPDEFMTELIEALNEQNIFRQICRVVSTSREKLKVPVATAAGVANWVEENAQIPESDSAFGQVILNAYKLGTMMRASTELIEDAAFNIQSYIAMEFARRIGTKEEEAFALGDGVGKPTGIFATTGGAGVGATASSATNITFDEVIDLFYSLKPPYRSKAGFVTNDSTLKGLRKLKSADGQYLWQPSVKDKTPDTILGRPVYTSPFVPQIAAGASVIAFGDFSYYWIADRRDTRFKVLNEKYAENDQIGFFATERVDGKLILPEAVKLLQMGS